MTAPIYVKVKEEELQGHSTRKSLYTRLEKLIGMPIISYFTSFRYPVMISDDDAEMIDCLLQSCDFKDGFALMISSPGGLGLAAERIINVCKSHSGNGEFSAIVPAKAKSAATMICLGAAKIIMGKTSELGPVDPQLAVKEGDVTKRFSVYNLVKSYESLFDRAIKEKGNLQPYMQQLANYDEREIAELRTQLDLSDDITIRALRSCMLKDLSADEIKKKINIFLIPEKRAKVHGRPIYANEAKNCGLNIEMLERNDQKWKLLNELYIRLNNFVSINKNTKVIECKEKSFTANSRQ